jgi:hypothetical protein
MAIKDLRDFEGSYRRSPRLVAYLDHVLIQLREMRTVLERRKRNVKGLKGEGLPILVNQSTHSSLAPLTSGMGLYLSPSL